jgi:hypothetical protein
MGTKREEFERLRVEIEHGKGDEKCHVVDVDAERRRRLENAPAEGKKPQQRLVIDCGHPDVFKEVYREWDRIYTRVQNKTMAVDMLIWWLRQLNDRRIDMKLNAGHFTSTKDQAL